MSDWLSQLTKDLKPVAETPPKGFLSVQELCAKLGRCESTVRLIMKQARAAGKVKCVMVRRVPSNGHTFLAPYYGPA